MSIELPIEVAPLPVLESRPQQVELVGTDFRTVATDLQDVQAWADRRAAPAGWAGDAAEAAQHAATRFARRVDVAEEALRLATTATTVFEEHLSRLRARRKVLDDRRDQVNADITMLGRLITTSALDEARLAVMAHHLRDRARVLREDVAAWHRDVLDAEAAYVAALRRIDTVQGAAHRQHTTGAPDAEALLHHLRWLAGGGLARSGPPDLRTAASAGLTLASITAWWRSLNPAQRQALEIAYPGIVGSTDGVPITDRDRANRAHAEATRGRLLALGPGEITDAQRQALHNLNRLEEQIHHYRHDVDPVSGRNLLHLIRFDPYAYDGDGGSIVSLGDPDSARYVSTYTPGFSAHGGELDGMGQVDALHQDFLHEYGKHVPAATILWDGYNNPSLDRAMDDLRHPDGAALRDVQDALRVVSPDAARHAGRHLAAFLDGLDATHQAGDPEVTVIGHSYGSVVVGYAAHNHARADNIVLLADPGAPGHNVQELVGSGGPQVYVGADDHDAISLMGRGPEGGPGLLGADPGAQSYGAIRIPVTTGPERLGDLLGNHSASKYLDGIGLDNVTTIESGGRPDHVAGRVARGYEGLSQMLVHAADNQSFILGAAAHTAVSVGDAVHGVGDALSSVGHTVDDVVGFLKGTVS